MFILFLFVAGYFGTRVHVEGVLEPTVLMFYLCFQSLRNGILQPCSRMLLGMRPLHVDFDLKFPPPDGELGLE